MTALKGYRTVIVAVLIAVLGALQGLDWVHLLPDNAEEAGWIVSVLGFVMMALRFMTDSALGKK